MRNEYSAKDGAAFVGVGSTGFSRDAGPRSELGLALEACTKAIADSGLRVQDIDGVVGTRVPTHQMIAALGLPEVVFSSMARGTIGLGVIQALHAVYSGLCHAVLLYHSAFRTPSWSRSAAEDPFRRALDTGTATRHDPEDIHGAVAYASWASRYVAQYSTSRTSFGYVAVNDRTNAVNNPLAAMRDPITMDDYHSARMVRDPLCILDMDVPVDGADAFVLTKPDRAYDLPHRPVLVHVACGGVVAANDEEQTPGLHRNGQHIVVDFLRARSDFWIDDIDIYFPYDGFSIITLCWMECSGFCGAGEAGAFLADSWDADANRLLLWGRVPVNSHGGALSEGGTQGSGHVREAIVQLRGEAGSRQVPGARRTLVTPGGLFYNAQGMLLHCS